MSQQPLNPEETDALYEAVRTQITGKTFSTDDPATLQKMIESLGDSRGITRLHFAEAIGAIGTPATPFLINAVTHHPNAVVRRAAAKTLTLIADPIAVPTLVNSLLTDPDTVVRSSVIGALAKTGEASVPALLEILASPDYPEDSKGLATWALAFIGQDAQSHIMAAIDSPNAEVRTAVIGTLGAIVQETRDADAIALLMLALDDPDSSARSEATTALSNIQHQPALPKLIDLIQTHPDPETRKAAALALMKIGHQSAIVPLETALEKESEQSIIPVIRLAIGQLRKKSNDTTEDW